MQVRPATGGDAAAIHDVARAAWEADYPDIVSRENATAAVEDWYDTDRIREAVDDPGTLVLVAETDGEVVGFAHAALSSERATGSILRLYAHPDHRRSGVGSELLSETVDELRDREVERVEAMVLAENEPGNDFYREAGFRHDGTGETRIAGESYEENVYVYGG